MAPFMDRDKVTKATAQIGFIKFVLIPMFETVTKVSGRHHEPEDTTLSTPVCTRTPACGGRLPGPIRCLCTRPLASGPPGATPGPPEAPPNLPLSTRRTATPG